MNRLEIEELEEQAEKLVSLSDILADALVAGGSVSIRYAGAARILEDGIRELHAKLRTYFEKEGGAE